MNTWNIKLSEGDDETVSADTIEIKEGVLAFFDKNRRMVRVFNAQCWNDIVVVVDKNEGSP